MSTLNLAGDRWILAVGQKPFWAGGNEFCTLAPVISLKGRRSKSGMFPNSGLVWWMVRSGARAWAQPGRLVVADLEDSAVYDEADPTKHLYQVDADGITPVGGREGVEILTPHNLAVDQPDQLVDRPALVKLDHYPTDKVWIKLKEFVFGPFDTEIEELSDSQFGVTLRLPPHDPTVYRVSTQDLDGLGSHYCQSCDAEISRSATARYDAGGQRVHYDLVIGEGVDHLLGLGEALTLETDEQVIVRAAKQLLPRSSRQQLTALLGDLEPLVAASSDLVDAADVVQAVQRRISHKSRAVDLLVQRLLQTGVLDQTISQRVEAAVQEELSAQSSRLMAEAEQQSAEALRRLEAVRRELEGLEENFEQRRLRETAELRDELNALQEEYDKRWADQHRQLAERERDLDERASRVRTSLEAAAQRLDAHREDALADALTILPLLAPMLPAQAAHPELSRSTAKAAPPEGQTLELPQYVFTGPDDVNPDGLLESEFFERFRQTVRDRGFSYETDDLVAFHISIKTSDITVLAGVSGTGKSSLPRLYMEAVQGERADELEETIGRYLHVAVKPSWLDQQDLLGHVNTLDHEFVPSESGLFPLLAASVTEHAQRRGASGIYLVCLDEMNLAQVEHYFGSFLSALERTQSDRKIRCFHQASVGPSSPFRQWSQIPLPPNIRFVGTVNRDETTRPLSLRFLDRTNEIELGVQDFQALRAAARSRSEQAMPSGRRATLRDFRTWMRDDPLSPDLAAILDSIREPLKKLRRPMTPRRYDALTRFVASASPLGDFCSPDAAFDLHLKMRMVPQLRSLGSPEAWEGLRDLVEAFEKQGYTERFPRTWESLQTVAADLRPILEFG